MNETQTCRISRTATSPEGAEVLSQEAEAVLLVAAQGERSHQRQAVDSAEDQGRLAVDQEQQHLAQPWAVGQAEGEAAEHRNHLLEESCCLSRRPMRRAVAADRMLRPRESYRLLPFGLGSYHQHASACALHSPCRTAYERRRRMQLPLPQRVWLHHEHPQP